MPDLLWDASALVKRYCVEVGTETVRTLSDLSTVSRMFVTISGFTETFAILVRKRNGGVLDDYAFEAAARLLDHDTFGIGSTRIVDVGYRDFLDSVPLIERHSINSSDAAILAAYLRHTSRGSGDYLLVAADHRLLRAAMFEGFQTLNPETVSTAELAGFLERYP